MQIWSDFYFTARVSEVVPLRSGSVAAFAVEALAGAQQQQPSCRWWDLLMVDCRHQSQIRASSSLEGPVRMERTLPLPFSDPSSSPAAPRYRGLHDRTDAGNAQGYAQDRRHRATFSEKVSRVAAKRPELGRAPSERV